MENRQKKEEGKVERWKRSYRIKNGLEAIEKKREA